MAAIICGNNTASAESWQAQIDSVYKQILERGDEKPSSRPKAQSHWVNEQVTRSRQSAMQSRETTRWRRSPSRENIMLYYRTRAIRSDAPC